jgi:hypothetical protein
MTEVGAVSDEGDETGAHPRLSHYLPHSEPQLKSSNGDQELLYDMVGDQALGLHFVDP